MISNGIRVSAALVALAVAGTGVGAPTPTQALEHYQRVIQPLSSGVYEWSGEDVLFVHVHVLKGEDDDMADLDAEGLERIHEELFKWCVGTAFVRQDAVLPQGMSEVRRLVREYQPLRENISGWKYEGTGQHVRRMEEKGCAYAWICSRSDVLASWPKDSRLPVPESVWIEGLTEIVRERFVDKADPFFEKRIGVSEVLNFQRGQGVVFPEWQTARFDDELRAYLSRKLDVEKEHGPCAQVNAEISDYLTTGALARRFRADALSVCASSVSRLEPEAPGVTVETNRVVTVNTNAVSGGIVRTNQSWKVFSGDDMGMPMPFGGKVDCVTVSADDRDVVEEEIVTVRTTRRTMLCKVTDRYHGTPRFESLFLSAAGQENKPSARVKSGDAAESAFLGSGDVEQRRRRVLEALRENPGDKTLWNYYGRMLFAEHDVLGAIVCYRNALRLDRQYEFALANMADAYRALNKPALSIAFAALARGVATDRWCVKLAEEILRMRWP